MIDSCRKQIVEEDAGLIADILCTVETDREFLLDLLQTAPDLRDDVLDDPKLVGAIMEEVDKSSISPRLYLYIGLRHFLCKQGLNDRELADYLSTMCVHFLFNTPWGTNNPMMRPDTYVNRVVDILADVTAREDWSRAWCLHSHLGHYLLFFTGLLPQVLHALELQGSLPHDSYETVAKYHFKQASNFDVPGAPICDKLHAHFSSIKKCLNELSISSFL